jgi:hypothetical protein
MPGVIDPRIVVVGTVHRVTPKTFEATSDRSARTIADVCILTDGGGLIEVRLEDPSTVDKPEVGKRVAWAADVSVFSPRNGSPMLWLKFAEVLEVPGAEPVKLAKTG